MSVSELVQCARALVGGELRSDFGFAVRNGTIAECGDFRTIRDRAADLPARSFPANRLIVPGFINGHSHAYQILLRGWADDWTFARWRSDALYKVVPFLTPDDVYWTFVAAFSEMLAAGITTVAEFFYLNGAGNAHAEAAIRAASDTGIRLVFARTWMDSDHAPPRIPRIDRRRREADGKADRGIPRTSRNLRGAALAARGVSRHGPRRRRFCTRFQLCDARACG